MQNFTTEQLIQYVYGEVSPEQNIEIEKALQYDWSLQEKLSVIKESLSLLDTVSLNKPRKQTLSAIMNHARQAAEVV